MRYLAAATAVFFTAWVTTFSAAAQSKLTDLKGECRGSGTDRDMPFQSFQKTTCHTKIEADETRMNSVTVFNGDEGLHKTIRMTVTLNGDKFTGSVSQSTLARGDKTPEVIKGSVLGNRIKDTANLRIRLPGLMPDATVALELRSPTSYTMQVKSLGFMLTNVTFSKVDKP